GLGAKDWPELGALEHVGEDVPVTASAFVGHAGKRTREHRIGIGAAVLRKVAHRVNSQNDAIQALDEQLADVSTAVVPHVDHHGLLANLRIEVPIESNQSICVHVWNVNVADLAVAHVGDILTAALHPHAV